jgi:hypothetical protein
MTEQDYKLARELVNTHWNGEYCPREVAIDAIAHALMEQREWDMAPLEEAVARLLKACDEDRNINAACEHVRAVLDAAKDTP